MLILQAEMRDRKRRHAQCDAGSLTGELVVKRVRTPVNTLPDELLLTIFSHLNDYRVLCRASQACKRWNSVAGDHSLWRVLYKRYFPSENAHPKNTSSVTDLKANQAFNTYEIEATNKEAFKSAMLQRRAQRLLEKVYRKKSSHKPTREQGHNFYEWNTESNKENDRNAINRRNSTDFSSKKVSNAHATTQITLVE